MAGYPPLLVGSFCLMMSAFERHPQVVGLAGEVGRRVIVDTVDLEGGAAQVAPEHREHPEVVGSLEGGRHLLELSGGLFGPPVDRGADADAAHLEGLLDRTEHGLVVLVRVVNSSL
jgi:hypothetical protein